METDPILKKKVRDIYGCKESVLRYLIKSNGSVEFTPKHKIGSIFTAFDKKKIVKEN